MNKESSVYLSVRLSIYMYATVCLSLSVRFIRLSVCPSVSVCLCGHLPISLSVCLPVHPPVSQKSADTHDPDLCVFPVFQRRGLIHFPVQLLSESLGELNLADSQRKGGGVCSLALAPHDVDHR